MEGSLDRTCTLTTGYFHVKIKISEENLRVDFYLLLKYLQKGGLKQFNFFQLAFKCLKSSSFKWF